jgi:galactonate dehydratase
MIFSDLRVYVIPAGWRNWLFLRITLGEQDGWAEFTDSNGSERTLLTCIAELKKDIVGIDFRDTHHMVSFLRRKYRQSLPGIMWKGISAIENAALDSVARATSTSVESLFPNWGQNLSRSYPAYWSHCPTTRIRAASHVDKEQIRTLDDLQMLSTEISALGFLAIKTNLVSLNPEPRVLMPGFSKTLSDFDQRLPSSYGLDLKRIIESLMFKAPKIEVIVDFNFNVTSEEFIQIQKSLIGVPIRWLEIDFDDPKISNLILDEAQFPICTGENTLSYWSYEKIIKDPRVSIVSIDVLWNGFSESLLIAEAAIQAGKKIAVHNYYGALANAMAATFFSLIPESSRELLEFDFDDVPWRDSLTERSVRLSGGHVIHDSGPGWGIDILESELRRRATYIQ